VRFTTPGTIGGWASYSILFSMLVLPRCLAWRAPQAGACVSVLAETESLQCRTTPQLVTVAVRTSENKCRLRTAWGGGLLQEPLRTLYLWPLHCVIVALHPDRTIGRFSKRATSADPILRRSDDQRANPSADVPAEMERFAKNGTLEEGEHLKTGHMCLIACS
jgi:hypothetical protein